MTDPNTLARLDLLERQNRRLRRAVAALALCITAFGALSSRRAEPAQTPEVRAERFVLVDPGGAELGSLGVDGKGFPLILLRKDKASAVLTLANPSLALRGDDGKRGAWIGQDTQGGVGMKLYGEKLLDGVAINVKPDGASGIYVLGADGRERATMELLADGTSAFGSRDQRGLPRTFFGLSPAGVPSLMLLDQNGAKRAGMLVNPDGAPLLSLDDARGQSRIELSQRFDGHARVRTFDEAGKTSFEAP
jgi:hypothetical protein